MLWAAGIGKAAYLQVGTGALMLMENHGALTVTHGRLQTVIFLKEWLSVIRATTRAV
jgi:hypothetical protein